jgi:hypothetical protein
MSANLIMGAIKDLVELVVKLAEAPGRGKFAAEINQIQILIAKIQSETATLLEDQDTKNKPENEGMCGSF